MGPVRKIYSRGSVDPPSPDPEPSHRIASSSEQSSLLPRPGSEDRPTAAAANEQRPEEEPQTSHHPFTRRALCLSLVLGAAGSAMNTFFGLRTGSVTGYAIPFAFVAKAAWTSSPLTDDESAVVVTMAVTMATMPMVAASLGVLPALQFLAGPREGGPVVLTTIRHLAWTQAIAYFPLFFAMLLRDRFLGQAELPFPSATAAAMMIDDKATATATQADLPRRSSTRPMDGFDTAVPEASLDRSEHFQDARVRPQENTHSSQVTTFLIPVALSGTLATRLIPGADFVHCIPLLATGCWYLDLSPGMVGLGMIAGPQIAYDLFISTLFGWGFLAWLSRTRGWVSTGRGRTGDWKRGVRSWIIWPGLGALLADCLVNVLGSLVEAACTAFRVSGNQREREQGANDTGMDDSEDDSQEVLERRSSFGEQAVERATVALLSPKAIRMGLAIITLLCPFLVNFVFANTLTWVEMFGAFVLAFPLSYMAIQATGRTDTTPASALAKVSQVVFALFADLDHYSHAFLINLVAGAVAEAGAVQAADLLLYQKLGRLLNLSGHVVFVAQILGSAFGGVLAVFWYWFFTTAGGRGPSPFPSGGADDEGFLGGLPAAHIWYATAKQALKGGLPPSASIAAAVTGGCFLLFAIAKFCSARQIWTFTRIRCPGTVRFESFSARSARWVPRVVVDYVERDWLALFPAGSSFAAAMNNSPHVTVAWSLGGVVHPILSRCGLETTEILLIGSGLMLGEGMAEIAVTLIEHWSPLVDKHVTCSMQC